MFIFTVLFAVKALQKGGNAQENIRLYSCLYVIYFTHLIFFLDQYVTFADCCFKYFYIFEKKKCDMYI